MTQGGQLKLEPFPGSAGAAAHLEPQTDGPCGHFSQKCLEEPSRDSIQNYMFYRVRIIKIFFIIP